MPDDNKNDVKNPLSSPPASASNTPKDIATGTQSSGTQSVAPVVSGPDQLALLTKAVLNQRSGPVSGTEGIDETVPGGRYRFVLPNGDVEWKNADGEELNDDGSLKYPGRQVKDVFGRLTTVR